MHITVRRAWLAAASLLYLTLTCYQLGLPGLHYDEAKEAGLNAMQLLTHAPVTAFRDAALVIGDLRLPLMVQDYIGALNVYLALPLLGLTGIGVPNLRLLPVLVGLAALLLIERTVSEWWSLAAGSRQAAGPAEPARAAHSTPLSIAGLLAVTLLAGSPTYVFWARQGIFVTNLVLPFVFLYIWQALRWLRSGRSSAFVLSALAAGLALYAKLSAYWVLVPFALLAGSWWLYAQLRHPHSIPRPGWGTTAVALLALLLPLLPLLAFNLQTGGTFASVTSNLGRSYYGVDNANVLANAPVRWSQVLQVLRGEQFWYLGAVYTNSAAPWLALIAVVLGLWRNWRIVLPPVLLAFGVFAASLFTVSNLFVTHYVLLQPILVVIGALGFAVCVDVPPQAQARAWSIQQRVLRYASLILLAAWLMLDITTSVRYHRALSTSGGLADHSDASYHLAYHLQYNGMGAPIALDWGIDAPVRYLTGGRVAPIEIFGYASPEAPDPQFVERLAPFLDNENNRYILHTPGATVFAGRREAFLAAVQERGWQAAVEQVFTQRDGAALYEIWRVGPHGQN